MSTTETGSNTRAAWAIHVFSSLGIVAGFLGLLSVLDGSPRGALTWMIVAMVIDGIDGPIARRYEIAKVVPQIDGNALDLMIDYVCCVVAPVVFMHRFRLLPHHSYVSLTCIALILISSLYVMSNKYIQTPDRYFRMFPAMWNIVVNVMFVFHARPWINVAFVVVLVVFSFVPLTFVHPMQVRDFRYITVPLLAVWLIAMTYVTWVFDERWRRCEGACLGLDGKIAQAIVAIGLIWLLAVGLLRHFRGPTDPGPPVRPGAPID